MLLVVEVDLSFTSEDKVVLAKSIIGLWSGKDWNEVVLFTELNQLRTVVFVDGSNLVNEERYLVLFA